MLPCVGVEEYANFSNTQKELLFWHWILGISMHHVQKVMQTQNAKEPNGKDSLSSVITPKFASTSNYSAPKCIYCKVSHAKK